MNLNFTSSSFFRQAWPQHCFLCAAACRHDPLCVACRQELPRLTATICAVCATPLAKDAVLCGACLRHPPAFAHTVAAWQYAWPLDRLIHAFKFHHQFSVLPVLSEPLLEQIRKQPLPEVIVPMPLHAQRLRQRGYNQALLLAQHLSRHLKIPLLKTACHRTRHTVEQSGLSRTERANNLRRAFACGAQVHGQHVALVDDVMTSGSSAHWLAQAMRDAGALSVRCWVLARTPPNAA